MTGQQSFLVPGSRVVSWRLPKATYQPCRALLKTALASDWGRDSRQLCSSLQMNILRKSHSLTPRPMPFISVSILLHLLSGHRKVLAPWGPNFLHHTTKAALGATVQCPGTMIRSESTTRDDAMSLRTSCSVLPRGLLSVGLCHVLVTLGEQMDSLAPG